MGVTDPNDRIVPLCPGGSDPICLARDADGNCRKWQCIDSSGNDEGGGGGGGGSKSFGGAKTVSPLWEVHILTEGRVYFKNTSVGCPVLEWEWDFGDSKYSPDKNPTHTYATWGTYEVTLRARTESGWYSKTASFLLTQAQFVGSRVVSFTYITSGMSAFFTDTSNVAGACLWDFGDGTSSTDQNPSHIYTVANSYLVTLTKENVKGTETVVIAALPPPGWEAVTWGANANVAVGVGTLRKNAGVDGNWDAYAVTTMLLDSTSDRAQLYSETLAFGLTLTGKMAQMGLDLSGSTDKDAVDFAIRFEDSGYDYSNWYIYENGVLKAYVGQRGWCPMIRIESGVVKYGQYAPWSGLFLFVLLYTSLTPASGNYAAVFNLQQLDHSGDSIYMKAGSTVTEATRPEITFFEAEQPNVEVNDTADINAVFTGTHPITYELYVVSPEDPEAAPTETGTVTDATYTMAITAGSAVPGIIQVKLVLTNAYGSDEASQEIVVTIADDDPPPIKLPPIAYMGADVWAGAPPLTVQFEDWSTGEGIESWLWDFGDGDTSTDQNPSHEYTNEGSFQARLTITAGPWTSTCTHTIFVSDLDPSYWPPIITDIYAEDNGGVVPFTTWVVGEIDGNAVSWLWDFGDGITCTLPEEAQHTWESPGTYTVKLTVANQFGATSATFKIVVLYWGAIDGDLGIYYILDTHNDRVLVYESDGTYLKHFGRTGALGGQLNYPTGMAAFNAQKYDGKIKIQ